MGRIFFSKNSICSGEGSAAGTGIVDLNPHQAMAITRTSNIQHPTLNIQQVGFRRLIGCSLLGVGCSLPEFYAINSRTTLPCTSVKRKSRPAWRKVSFV